MRALKDRMQFQVVQDYFLFLTGNNLFSTTTSSTNEMRNKLGTLKFLRTTVERFARNTQKAVGHGWIPLEEGKTMDDVSKSMLAVVEDSERTTKQKIKALESVFHLDKPDHTSFTFASLSLDKSSTKPVTGNSSIDPETVVFPQDPTKLIASFASWFKTLDGPHGGGNGFIFVRKIFSALPAVNDPY